MTQASLLRLYGEHRVMVLKYAFSTSLLPG